MFVSLDISVWFSYLVLQYSELMVRTVTLILWDLGNFSSGIRDRYFMDYLGIGTRIHWIFWEMGHLFIGFSGEWDTYSMAYHLGNETLILWETKHLFSGSSWIWNTNSLDPLGNGILIQ